MKSSGIPTSLDWTFGWLGKLPSSTCGSVFYHQMQLLSSSFYFGFLLPEEHGFSSLHTTRKERNHEAKHSTTANWYFEKFGAKGHQSFLPTSLPGFWRKLGDLFGFPAMAQRNCLPHLRWRHSPLILNFCDILKQMSWLGSEVVSHIRWDSCWDFLAPKASHKSILYLGQERKNRAPATLFRVWTFNFWGSLKSFQAFAEGRHILKLLPPSEKWEVRANHKIQTLTPVDKASFFLFF